ncbi:MAG: dihydrodipicolinate synthase family protein [Chloroflexi bacterium]|nr:dihydrodipicolinate synthase family protein [Chloroflexota bacterium]
MFRGIWPALVTPLTEEEEVDIAATESLVGDLLAAGVGGLYVCGGTGEGVLLPARVRREMAEVVIRAVAGQVPVMVHIGALRTETAVELAQHANLAGCDAISAVPPFYYSYSFAAIKAHYEAIARASQVPLYLYHIPAFTGVSLSVEQLLELCALEGIAGLKYSSHDLYTLSRLLAQRDPDRVNILSGPDELFLPCYSLGVEGAIGTTYNFMPRLYVDIMGAAQKGDLATARRLQYAANGVIAVLLRYGVIPATKALLGLLGYRVGRGVRPMPAIEGEELKALRRDLEQAGLFGLLRRHALYGPTGDPMRGHLA